MKKIKLYANAKINLFLDIDSIRDNGYHNIKSIMQSVSLYDVITLEYNESTDKKISIICNTLGIPTDSKNIAYKAADRLLESGEVTITIEKNIPSPAGLAGGSADAAAVIYGLTKIASINKTQEEIIDIAARIGADVPFCLVGGNKRISGIGEIMEDGENLVQNYVLVAIKGEGVSTPIAYSMLDEKYDYFKNYFGCEESAYNALKKDEGKLFNIFEEVILPIRPDAAAIKEKMIAMGAKFSLMSGSGPSVFGIFDSMESMDIAKKALLDMGASVYSCSFANKGIEEIAE